MIRYTTRDGWFCDDPADNELGPDPRPDRSDAPWLRKGPLPVACEHCLTYSCRGECQENER